MKRSLKSELLVLTGLMVFLAGCSRVEITGRRQLTLVPDSMIHSMSSESYGEFLAQHKRSADVENTQMVKRTGSRIQKAIEQYCAQKCIENRLAGYQWEFNLIEDPNVNAWCMPGGKVVVYTGLLPIAKTETGLAVVMGHEIAHAFARHGAERMTQGLLVDLGGMALSEALRQKPEATKNLFMQSYGLGAQIGVLLPYSRLHENEADRLGLIFMAMAGYDPREAVAFWQRMAAGKTGAAPPEFLSTHPAGTTRIRNIQALIPEAMQYYRAP